MTKNEIKVFKSLCAFKAKNFDADLEKYATPSVLGHLFFNRMQGIAYGILKEHGILGKVNREFRNSLKGAYEQNVCKNESFLTCIQLVNQILEHCTCPYALLKGAYLCGYYPKGYRTSNDIDILTSPENVTEIGKLLAENGFKQGNIRNGEFVEATRKEIIESKMMRGETVPYIKEIGLPGMRFLEIDINFSLDFKNGDLVLLEKMLNNVCKKQAGEFEIQTLSNDDFFIHLCGHLYKEATTLPWVKMKRDMTLYKYSDIYLLLSEMHEDDVERLFCRATQLGMEKICAFAIIQTNALYDTINSYADKTAKTILAGNENFLYEVFSPEGKKTLIYDEKDINKLFFSDNRVKHLKEASDNEKT